MNIQIEFNCDNAAFEENPQEIANILQDLANYYRCNGSLPDSIKDSNGNRIGRIYKGE